MNAFIAECVKANEEIYEYINTHISKTDYEYSSTIGVGGDNSLNIDLICENIFIKYLLPFGNIYTEERGYIESNSLNRIIIDPLDGSSNFQASLPYFGTSVAFEVEGEIEASIICNLSKHTLLYKYKNNDAIEIDLLTKDIVSNFRENSSELGIFERAYAYPKISQKLYNNGIKFRSPGAAALSLAYSKNFSFVLFAGKVREFDILAALHICGDLHIYQNKEFLIVSKNYVTFELIKEIIKE